MDGQEKVTPPRVLVVDDERRVLDAIARAIRSQAFEVDKAQGYQEAEPLLKSNQYAVIVTDQRMPQVTGLELLQRAKEYQPRAKTMMLTASRTANLSYEAINHAGVTHFMTKPFDSKGLLDVIEYWVQEYTARAAESSP